MRKIFIFLLSLYQKYISPLLGAQCRYIPSCSEYAKQSFIHHSFFKAIYLSIARIGRCHPFSKGGYDPPPS